MLRGFGVVVSKVCMFSILVRFEHQVLNEGTEGQVFAGSWPTLPKNRYAPNEGKSHGTEKLGFRAQGLGFSRFRQVENLQENIWGLMPTRGFRQHRLQGLLEYQLNQQHLLQ